MRLPIDRRAWPAAFILLSLAAASRAFFKSQEVFLFFLLLTAGHLAFFRDPVRKVPEGDGPVSAADGKVAEITRIKEDQYLKEDAIKIGIFLSVFVPHVNRAPIDGTVEFLRYVPGKFLNALRADSADHNESNWIGISQGKRRVLVRQIAGAIARRIYWDVQKDQNVKRRDKVGIICYGSRVECFFPAGQFQPAVKIGQRVKAGESLLGKWLP